MSKGFKSMLDGFDLSHHNKIIDYDKVEGDFVILKATQGTTFVDPTYRKNIKEFRKRGKLIGHYHFVNGNNYEKEAQHFLDNVDLHNGDIILLDYEIQMNNPVEWCYNWLREVEKKTGVKPLIYLRVSLIRGYNWSKVIENGNGLWIADYKNAPARIGKWKFWAVRQITALADSKGIIGSVDRDEFNGNKEQWKLYGYHGYIGDTGDDSCKQIKASLTGCFKKNKELRTKVKILEENIDGLETLKAKEAKEVKIVSALVFFIKSIISKLK